MKLLLPLFACLIIMNSIAQEPGKVKGMVFDYTDYKPIDSVIVEVLNTGIKARTNSKGGFTIQTIAPGTYDLFFQNAKYGPFTLKNVNVKSGETTYLSIPMVKFEPGKDYIFEAPNSNNFSTRYYLEIVRPDLTIEYKLLVKKPDPDIDYKILDSKFNRKRDVIRDTLKVEE
jgi:hypothetical protein